jgi:hypothetical protein
VVVAHEKSRLRPPLKRLHRCLKNSENTAHNGVKGRKSLAGRGAAPHTSNDNKVKITKEGWVDSD